MQVSWAQAWTSSFPVCMFMRHFFLYIIFSSISTIHFAKKHTSKEKLLASEVTVPEQHI